MARCFSASPPTTRSKSPRKWPKADVAGACTTASRRRSRLVDGSTVRGHAAPRPPPRSTAARAPARRCSRCPRGTRVRAGMFLRGEAQLPPRNVLAVPQSSILYDSGQAYVFVIDRRRRAIRLRRARANIALGARERRWVEVTTGLAQGAAHRRRGRRIPAGRRSRCARMPQQAQAATPRDRRSSLAAAADKGRNLNAWPGTSPPARSAIRSRRSCSFSRLLFAGWTAYFRLPINQLPNIDFGGFTVTVAQPGAAPAEMETQITQRVEAALTAVEGVKRVTSTISPGVSDDDGRDGDRNRSRPRRRRCARRDQPHPRRTARRHQRAGDHAHRRGQPADRLLRGRRPRA